MNQEIKYQRALKVMSYWHVRSAIEKSFVESPEVIFEHFRKVGQSNPRVRVLFKSADVNSIFAIYHDVLRIVFRETVIEFAPKETKYWAALFLINEIFQHRFGKRKFMAEDVMKHIRRYADRDVYIAKHLLNMDFELVHEILEDLKKNGFLKVIYDRLSNSTFYQTLTDFKMEESFD